MWRPPQRIRYQPDPGPAPDRKTAESARLFSPVSIGSIELTSRTWVPAMVPWRASDEGFITDDAIGWYERFAQGRPGAIVVEATGIRDIPSGPLLRIGDDRYLPGLEKLVKAVDKASGGRTRLLIQLIDFLSIRRRAKREVFFARHLKITDDHRTALGLKNATEDDVRTTLAGLAEDQLEQTLSARELETLNKGYRERVTDMHLEHIRTLPDLLPGLFADAALRAQSAGFDGIELHYAHAYTMASFLSALNTREDGYGGAREQRVKLPLEVFARVREAVGSDFPTGCRFLAEECIPGGNEVADAAFFGVEFARAGMDFLSLSRGGKFEDAKQPGVGAAVYPYTGPSGYECMPSYISDERGPFGRNVDPSHQIRIAVREAGFDTPVVVTGGIHGFQQAEQLLREDKADIVGAARQSLADPDWFAKVRAGRGDEVRVCEYTNYCEGLDQKHKQVTCKLWDRTNIDEPGIALTADGKRRLLAPS